MTDQESSNTYDEPEPFLHMYCQVVFKSFSEKDKKIQILMTGQENSNTYDGSRKFKYL